MKITFLGTSHGFNEPGRFCSSSVITTNGKNYIIDAGAPIMGLLQTYGFNFRELNHIFITHSHRDHYLGLLELTSQIEGFGEFSDVHFTVHTPQKFPLEPMFQYIFGNPLGKVTHIPGADGEITPDQRRVEYVEYPDEESVIFEDENIKITAIPNAHMPHSHSFLVECEGKRVFYSGDLVRNFADLPAFLTDPEENKLNLVLLEGAHTRLNKPEIKELLGRLRTQRLLVTHVNYAFNTHEIVDELRDAVSDKFPVEEAFDGLIVRI